MSGRAARVALLLGGGWLCVGGQWTNNFLLAAVTSYTTGDFLKAGSSNNGPYLLYSTLLAVYCTQE